MSSDTIDNVVKNFLKISFSVSKHNSKYTQSQLGMCLISCANARESIEEGVSSPSPQTMRDRLQLNGAWLEKFHEISIMFATFFIKLNRRLKWFISIDETLEPFYGKVKKLSSEAKPYISSYRNDVKGATGSFKYMVVSICCKRYKIPLAITPMKTGKDINPWLEDKLRLALELSPKSAILADRGFNSVKFFQMLERLNCKYVVRMTVRDKSVKKKIKNGNKKIVHWIKDNKTKESVLLNMFNIIDKFGNKYVLTSNLDTPSQFLLKYYRCRWDIENIFKMADRVQLKTSSVNIRMRLFSIVFSFLLHLLWQTKDKSKMSLRTFVKSIIGIISKIIGFILDVQGKLMKIT